jgi:sugar phosphate permease
MNSKSLKSWQIRIFILCWFAYACIYLGRNNLSVAIPEIQRYLGISKAQIGIIGGSFLWVYGIGQLINGYIGDKVSSRIYIFIGLLVTALTNIFFGFASSLTMMSILWVVNGYFQSMLWGPMSKTITHWVLPEKRSFAAIAISTSGVGGTLLALILAGQIMDNLSWRWVFIIPGIIILIFSFVWHIFVRNHPRDVGFDSLDTNTLDNTAALKSYTLLEVIKETRLWFVVIACFAQGIVKDGINLWAPTFFMEAHNLDIKSVATLMIIIPVMNFVGMLFSGWLNRILKYKEKIATAVLFIIGIFMILGLKTLGNNSTIIGIIFLSLFSATMNGANALLLGVIPMKFIKYNKVSAIAGTLDFCSYFVSGLAASVTGIIVDLFGWSGVMVFWMIVTVIGTFSLVLSQWSETGIMLKKDSKSPAGF